MYRYIVARSCGKVYTLSNVSTLNGRRLAHRAYSSGKIPQFQEAGFGKILVILTPFAVGGGVAAYASYDKEFRKLVEDNVPGADKALKILLQEEKPLEDLSKKVSEYTSVVTGFFGGSDSVKEEPKPVKKEQYKPPVTSTPPSTKPTQKPVESSVPTPPLAKPTSTAKPTKKEEPKAEIPKPQPPAPLPRDVSELEKLAESAANTAIKHYQNAVKILQGYNEDVKRIVEDAHEKIDHSSWVILKNKTSARDSAVKAAESAANEAKQAIENIEKSLYKVDSKVPAEAKEVLKNKVRNYIDSLEVAKKEVYNAIESSDLTEKYWRNIETARNHFIKDIEDLFPNVNFAQKKLELTKDEIDLFLVLAHSKVVALQKELQKISTEGDLRLRRAIDAIRGGGEGSSDAVRAQVQYEMEKLKREIELENQSKMLKIRYEAEKELRNSLKKQAEAHLDHVKEALEVKEIEMRRKFQRELEEKLSNENANYKQQLATMIGKIKGMDDALKARADSERSAHQAQNLWGACQALWSSVRAGQPGVSWKEKLRPLTHEIKAVAVAAEGDELVAVVLKGLPEEAIKRGVYPEDALRERFIKVNKVAHRLAMVPEGGARLPVYLLSFLQSMLIINPSNAITKDELQDKPVDFSQFDNFDILNRAKYWLERGDLTQALKYMNLLKGASRTVSEEWMKEARLLLETQQAANTLMAHAGANSLRYL
uniref:MICOS complex subunit MIC60 n=1 Tax=Culicoides sonorensis TaxID=179676 RepID=A0A336M9P5_CULSO